MAGMVPAASKDSPRVIALPPLIYVGGLVLGFFAHWADPRPMMAPSLRPWLALPILVLGIALAGWGRQTLVGAGTNVDPRKPAIALVTSGPFAWSRNPLYIALALIYLAIACFANDFWFLPVLAVVLAVVHYGVIHREERYLEAKFGDAYRQYCARVGRWL
jgi:protein-S-isoprenylcysteine O-methyltransferase Ste14